MPKRLFWGILAGVSALLVVWALPRHPGFVEWLCRHRSLGALQQIQRRLPENPISLYYLGQALHQTGRSAEALPLLQHAASLDPDTPRIREAWAQTQMALGQTQETFQMLRAYLETHPNTPEAFQMMGRFLIGVQSFARALPILDEATRRFPDEANGWALLANARRRLRDLRGAQEAATKASALQPQNGELWILRARIAREARQSEARDAYANAVRALPGDRELRAEFVDYLARAAASPADLAQAERDARALLLEVPMHPRASGALGLVLAQRQEAEKAIPLLQCALADDADDILILRTLERLARQTRDLSQAQRWERARRRAQTYRDTEKRLQDALEKTPRDRVLLLQMAQLTGRHGDTGRAIRYHALARGVSPDAPAALLAAAHDLQSGGFATAAESLARRALQNQPTAPQREQAQRLVNSPR